MFSLCFDCFNICAGISFLPFFLARLACSLPALFVELIVSSGLPNRFQATSSSPSLYSLSPLLHPTLNTRAMPPKPYMNKKAKKAAKAAAAAEPASPKAVVAPSNVVATAVLPLNPPAILFNGMEEDTEEDTADDSEEEQPQGESHFTHARISVCLHLSRCCLLLLCCLHCRGAQGVEDHQPADGRDDNRHACKDG